jgi:hypothetical protein
VGFDKDRERGHEGGAEPPWQRWRPRHGASLRSPPGDTRRSAELSSLLLPLLLAQRVHVFDASTLGCVASCVGHRDTVLALDAATGVLPGGERGRAGRRGLRHPPIAAIFMTLGVRLLFRPLYALAYT